MKRVVVAVFDSATGTFGQPFFVPAEGAAVRSFRDEVNRSAADNSLFMHPEDYTLYALGKYDDEEGTFEGNKAVLVRGKDMKEISQ